MKCRKYLKRWLWDADETELVENEILTWAEKRGAISTEGRVRSVANRNTLHISKLEAFKKWLVKDGWEIEEPKGIWEVLRARKSGKQNPLIVYRKADPKEHLSFMNRDIGVVGAFLRDCKKTKTNADRIRSMTNEELAMNMMCPNENGLGEIDCDKRDNCNCYECILKWMQSEVEE